MITISDLLSLRIYRYYSYGKQVMEKEEGAMKSNGGGPFPQFYFPSNIIIFH